MGAILVIEDDHDLKGLIEKILPASQFKVIGKNLDDPTASVSHPENASKGDPNSALEEIVREVLKAEVVTGNAGHIHESVIGKVERALIGIVLEEERGNQVRVAKRLGINRNTLRKKMKDLQISTRVVTH
jgi:two-component system nitrogen regulation response regulator GlnG